MSIESEILQFALDNPGCSTRQVAYALTHSSFRTIRENVDQQQLINWLNQQSFEYGNIRKDMQERLLILAPEVIAEYGIEAPEVTAVLESIPQHHWHNIRSLRARFRLLMDEIKAGQKEEKAV